ncbi:MAG: hypothetical protein DRG78_01910 [Epsilonproteobacteria bacterium]|nr:MAG: hypothetical protein DRG78_01910 [Campylobacterota bacterium]
MIIEKNKVIFENGNKAHVFGEIGYAEELGSGVKNLYKYSKIYGGSDPKLEESDIFTTTILLENTTPQVTPLATPQADKKSLVLEFCTKEKSIKEIMDYINVSDKKHFRETVLNPLINEKSILLTIPNKPKSPNQRYIKK